MVSLRSLTGLTPDNPSHTPYHPRKPHNSPAHSYTPESLLPHTLPNWLLDYRTRIEPGCRCMLVLFLVSKVEEEERK